ncbi:unnamed protein product [Thelazia callipaeda]|uniref:tRNA-uridine aminocarboxypropyltransferase 1 n=1 Tax=Thelazia callipaeda TaxID=103827 RepID=A0A0N5D5E8_THECL|nr:unnamed protein product [Thelazia callipaeda]
MMEHLKISDWSALDNLEKKICSNCGRRRMYFCYDCKLYIPGVQNMVPQLKLPVHIDIIKHPQEKNSKSTALHCLLLAPTCTRLFDLTNVPNYNSTKYKQENTALVIQSENGISVHSFVKERGCIKRFVFLDSTWFQIGRLKSLSKIQSLPVITLRSYKTKYWRPQVLFPLFPFLVYFDNFHDYSYLLH